MWRYSVETTHVPCQERWRERQNFRLRSRAIDRYGQPRSSLGKAEKHAWTRESCASQVEMTGSAAIDRNGTVFLSKKKGRRRLFQSASKQASERASERADVQATLGFPRSIATGPLRLLQSAVLCLDLEATHRYGHLPALHGARTRHSTCSSAAAWSRAQQACCCFLRAGMALQSL